MNRRESDNWHPVPWEGRPGFGERIGPTPDTKGEEMGPYTLSALDMLDFFERQREWSYETFGPPSFKGPLGPLNHLAKEAQEAIAEADRATHLMPGWSMEKLREEIADCLFLVFDAAHRAGMSYADLASVAMAKLRKNKARKWPDWRGTDPDQPIEHDRSGEGAPAAGKCRECGAAFPAPEAAIGEIYCSPCRASRAGADRR